MLSKLLPRPLLFRGGWILISELFSTRNLSAIGSLASVTVPKYRNCGVFSYQTKSVRGINNGGGSQIRNSAVISRSRSFLILSGSSLLLFQFAVHFTFPQTMETITLHVISLQQMHNSHLSLKNQGILLNLKKLKLLFAKSKLG